MAIPWYRDNSGKRVQALQIRAINKTIVHFFGDHPVVVSEGWLATYPVKPMDFYVMPEYGVNSWGMSRDEFLQQYRPL